MLTLLGQCILPTLSLLTVHLMYVGDHIGNKGLFSRFNVFLSPDAIDAQHFCISIVNAYQNLEK